MVAGVCVSVCVCVVCVCVCDHCCVAVVIQVAEKLTEEVVSTQL